MDEDPKNMKRPGRKALFIGAASMEHGNDDTPEERECTEFAGCVLDTVTRFNTGDKTVRIDEEKTGERYIDTARSLNSLLEKFSNQEIPETDDNAVAAMELEVKRTREELSLSSEKLESCELEISRLNDIIREKERAISEKEKEIPETSTDKFRQELEDLRDINARKENELKSSGYEIKKLKEENGRLKDEQDSEEKEYLARISGLEELNTTLSEDLEKEKSEAEILRRTVSEGRDRISSTESELKDLKDESARVKDGYETRIKEYDSKTSALEKEKKRLEDLEAKRAEEEKKRKAEQETSAGYYDAAIRDNPLPVILLDAGLGIRDSNRAFEAMSGIPGAKLKSMSIRDMNITDTNGPDLSLALKSGTGSRSEIRIRFSSGVRCLEQFAIPVRNNNNQAPGLLLIFSDVTKEKEEADEIRKQIAEIENLKKRSETIVQQNPMPILLMNRKFGIIVANEAFGQMSGIAVRDLLKMNAKDFRIREQHGDGLKYSVENKVRASGEIVVEMPSGVHVLEQYTIPILDEKGQIVNILAVYNDITEIRRKNLEIEELRKTEQAEAELLTTSAGLITEKMIGMKSGDLTVKAEIFEDDPLEVLKTGFNSSVEEFHDLISTISGKADLMESTSEDLSGNSDDIARANEKLALNSEESAEYSKDLMDRFEKISLGISDLSASIEEISGTSQEVMKQTNLAAVEGKNAAEIGKEASEMMETVGRISQQSVNEINLLNQEMYKINEIVKLIRGIAEQTNMLALNAAIEAARAGEHGRGFAVVAGEVKNLAGESKEATGKIEALISAIQKNSDDTANSMIEADSGIRKGIESVNSAVNALYKIAGDIGIASRGITDISHATETQAYEINSFMKNIEEATVLTRGNLDKLEGMAALAEEISATTQEVGSISHEVHEISVSLKQIMQKFRLE